MGTVSTRIEEGDGFKVLRYGLGSIVLIIGYPQSESDLIDARDAIAKQFDYEISMNGRRHGGHRSVRAAAMPESVVDLNQRPPQGGTRIEIDRDPSGTPRARPRTETTPPDAAALSNSLRIFDGYSSPAKSTNRRLSAVVSNTSRYVIILHLLSLLVVRQCPA